MVTYAFASAGPIRHNEVNQNFTDVETLAKAIGNSQITGGLTADKLSDKYDLDIQSWQLIPPSLIQDLNTTGAAACYITPDALTSLWKLSPVLKSGYESFLCAAKFYAVETRIATTAWPSIAIYRNTDQLGGQAVTIDASDTWYTLANQDPTTNPLTALANGDYIDIKLGRSDASAQPRIRGLVCMLALKHVLIS